MNAKHSHCMNRMRIISLLLAVAVSTGFAAAQDTGEQYRAFKPKLPYPAAVAHNVWNDGANINGIRQDQLFNSSYAELYGNYIGGGFKSSSQPTTGWKAGARAGTLVHLKRFSMKGAFSFEQFQGENMAGSMFITPGYYPVDVIEFTPGRKTKQTYSFDGGVSVDVSDLWRVGGKMDFTSANYSKRKDLRHTNYRLDMTVAPGVLFHTGSFAVGANYIFNKESESVDPEQIGTGESSYYAFLDKGILYGKYEVWTGSGVHLDESGVTGFPVKVLSHGAAAQISYEQLFFEFKYMHSQGTVGEKQFNWFRFPGNEYRFTLNYRIDGGRLHHSISAKAGIKTLRNYETVLEKVTQGGVTTVAEYGSNLIYGKKAVSGSLEYGLKGEGFSIGLLGEVNSVDETASQMYPYIFRQNMLLENVRLSVSVPARKFLPSLAVGYRGGIFHEWEESLDETSGVVTRPYKLQNYWAGQMEYLTTPQIYFTPSLRYTFSNGLYIEAGANVVKAFRLQIIKGSVRYDATLRFGYNF